MIGVGRKIEVAISELICGHIVTNAFFNVWIELQKQIANFIQAILNLWTKLLDIALNGSQCIEF